MRIWQEQLGGNTPRSICVNVSSLSHLHRLRVDTVKLDRSFVSRIGLEHAGAEIVRAIVALAHTLETDVVGEGVETPEQLESLMEFGCDYGQGYLFARAIDAAGATRLLREQPWRIDDRDESASAVRRPPKRITPLVA